MLFGSSSSGIRDGRRPAPAVRTLQTLVGAVALIFVAAQPLAHGQTPVSTAFTYQGRLLDGGNPPTGAFDFDFRLFDAAAAGAQVGLTQCRDNVTITSGLFTVNDLDFGAVWNGSARWLELRVRAGGALANCNLNLATYTLLGPRQPLTGTPYALGIRLTQPEAITSASAALDITNNGTGNAAHFDGPDNNGTTAGLRVTSGAQTMLMDGNELDSSVDLFINNNTANNVILATGGGHVGVGHSTPPGSLTVGSPSVFNVFVPGDSTCFAAQATAGCSDAGCQNLVCAIDSFCCNNTWDGLCVDEANTLCIGRVGIGTNAAEARLHIAGGSDVTGAAGGFLILGSLGGQNIGFDNNEIQCRNNGVPLQLALNASGGNVHLIQNGAGSVGIGTTTPVSALQVANGDLTFKDTGGFTSGAGSVQTAGDLIMRKNIDSTTNDVSWFRWFTDANSIETMRINSGDEAEIDGDGTFDSNGIDYAEAFKITQADLEPGDVVSLSIGNWEHIVRTTQGYDPQLAGIVSTKPGFCTGMSFDAEDAADPAIREQRDAARVAGDWATERELTMQLMTIVEETYRRVALLGRVPTKVDAAYGPIQAGDRLTSSPTPGHAMKQTQPGQSIGVALEDWTAGTGKIIVFVQPGWFGGTAETTTPTTATPVSASATTPGQSNAELLARISALEAMVAELAAERK